MGADVANAVAADPAEDDGDDAIEIEELALVTFSLRSQNIKNRR